MTRKMIRLKNKYKEIKEDKNVEKTVEIIENNKKNNKKIMTFMPELKFFN